MQTSRGTACCNFWSGLRVPRPTQQQPQPMGSNQPDVRKGLRTFARLKLAVDGDEGRAPVLDTKPDRARVGSGGHDEVVLDHTYSVNRGSPGNCQEVAERIASDSHEQDEQVLPTAA